MAQLEIYYKSKAIFKSVHVTVLLPCDDEVINDCKPPYKTLYYLAHFTGNANTLSSFIQFRLQAAQKGIAVVLIDGDNSFYLDRPEHLASYSSYIMEIVELTRNYCSQLSRRKEDTYIGGASMGGWGAILNGIRYHDVFDKIIAFSPLIDPYGAVDAGIGFTESQIDVYLGSRENYAGSEHNLYRCIVKANEDNTLPALFVCCGDSDDIVGYQSIPFIHWLEERNVEGEFIVNKGGHDVIYWNEMLPTGIDFLIP